MWDEEPAGEKTSGAVREYEIVGYALEGEAELEIEGQTILIEAGDSWLVPAGARHSYAILKTFTAIEATSPPARVHGRDEKPPGLD